MKTRMILFAVLALSAFLTGCISYSVSPSDKSVNVNDDFSVDIELDNCLGPVEILGFTLGNCVDTGDVYGVAFDMNYDHTVLQLQGVDTSSSVLSDVSVTTGFRNSASENGKLVVGISKQGQVAGEEGRGIIATINFRAIAEGDTYLTFNDPHLLNSQGEFYIGWPLYMARLMEGFVSVAP